MTHTPAPWMITIINAQRQFEIHAEDGVLVALAAPVDRHGVFKTQANALLIATAPELLNALRQLTYEIAGRFRCDDDMGDELRHVVKQARAAIAKVEGTA
jgi:hypothetical protein